MKTLKKAAGILVTVLLWGIIAAAALFTFTTMATRDAGQVKDFLGYTPMSVQSDSMKPTFAQGDLIIVKSCEPDALQVGDIICFHAIIQNQYALNTHRIIEIENNGSYKSFVTRGDNNEIEDQHRIVDGDIVGRYVGRLPGVGRLMDFLGSSIGFLLVIVLPLLVFFIYQIYHLIMIGINLKKAAVLEAAEANGAAADMAEVEKLRAEAEKAKEEAEKALAEAKRLKAEAEQQNAEKAEQ